MRTVPGWVMGAAGVGVVAAAFFLGGRIAATERVPATPIVAEVSVVPAAAGYLQAVSSPAMPTVRNQFAPVQRTSAARAPVSRAPVKAKRSTQKSVAIIAGSAAAGAVVGGVAKGKKGAVIGGIVGGAAATIWDQVTRRK